MVTMHYATPKYDEGPIVWQFPVSLEGCNWPDDVAKRVNELEHIIQPQVTEAVANGQIAWSWDPWDSVSFPDEYKFGEELPLTDVHIEGKPGYDGMNGKLFMNLFPKVA